MKIKLSINQIKQDSSLMKSLVNHFNYSIEQVSSYDELTNAEKLIISRDKFIELTEPSDNEIGNIYEVTGANGTCYVFSTTIDEALKTVKLHSDIINIWNITVLNPNKFNEVIVIDGNCIVYDEYILNHEKLIDWLDFYNLGPYNVFPISSYLLTVFNQTKS